MIIPIPVSAAGDSITVVNNLSDFVFGLIRAIGLILLGFGVVQIGLSLKSHDPSQRANGFMTLVLIIAIGATGLAGGAAITAALAALGPGGMIGGILTLGTIGLISEAIAEYGVDAIFKAVLIELYKRGETKDLLLNKVSKYPISKQLKLKLTAAITKIDENNKGDENDESS